MLWSLSLIVVLLVLLHEAQEGFMKGQTRGTKFVSIEKFNFQDDVFEPNHKDCGRVIAKSARLISNGINTTKEEVPSYVGLETRLKRAGKILAIACGGLLIDDDLVLTAAHCVELMSSIEVSTATHSVRSAAKEKEPVYKAANWCHPKKYQGFRRPPPYDYAVITLPKKVTMGKKTQTACLTRSKANTGQKLMLVGSGMISEKEDATGLQYLIVKKSKCSISLEPQLMCAVSSDPKRPGMACHGDSGGPLYTSKDGTVYVESVVSAGPSDCSKKSTEFYSTDIFEVYDDLIKLIKFCRGDSKTSDSYIKYGP